MTCCNISLLKARSGIVKFHTPDPHWLVITLTLPTRSLGCWKLHALDIVQHDSICRSFYLRALLLSRYCPAERTGKLDYATFFHCRCSAQ